MTVEQMRRVLQDGGFSPETHAAMSAILDAAEARGHVLAEEKEKLLELIDLDITATMVEADAMDEMASVYDEFAQEADEAIRVSNAEFEKAESDLLIDLQALMPEVVAA